MNPVAPDAPEHDQPSRRSVLRSAAWGVPAVGLAAATPAFAASTRQLRIQLTTPARWNRDSITREYMSISLTVTNLSNATPSGALSFYLRFSNVLFGQFVSSMSFLTASGGAGGTGANAYGLNWTKSENSTSGIGTNRTGGATFTLSSLGPGQTSAILGLRVTSDRFLFVDPTSNTDPVLIQEIVPPNTFSMAPTSLNTFTPIPL